MENFLDYHRCCRQRRPPGGTTGQEAPPELSLRTIYFYYDTPAPKPESDNTLTQLFDIMHTLPSVHVQITGHTSLEGTFKHNQELSQIRADHVRAYLTARGIDSSRINIIGLGESAPAVTEPHPEPRGRSLRMPEGEAIRDLNRRAEVTFYDPSGSLSFLPRFPLYVLSTRDLSLTPPGRFDRPGSLLGSQLLRW